MRVDVWHNIMWSSYKARVLTELFSICNKNGVDAHIFQIAETEGMRVGLGNVNLKVHNYDYTLLFPGSINNVPLFKMIRTLVGRVNASNADIMVFAGYDRPEYWAQIVAAKLKGAKVAVFCDSTIWDRKQTALKSIVKRIIFSFCDRIFCYGARARDYVVSLGVDPKKISFRCQAAALPDDYDSAKIAPLRREARAAKGHGQNLLYVGRLSPEKNIPFLLKALARLKAEDKIFTLDIVGSGGQENELKELVRALDLEAEVRFVGSLSGQALYDQYLGASAFVLPSTSEPWGLVVNEALSFGCPVVVSDRCGCVPELVIEGRSGFAFSPTDEESLCGALLGARETFTDEDATVRNCLDVIHPYTPQNAAMDIFRGLGQMLPAGGK